tara:strand:+ start:440 stop:712 length:273 start_codon:yes stop_codon:yes gene_type:complete
MNWKDTISKATLNEEAKVELKANMKEVSNNIRIIQTQFKETPVTEQNQYDHAELKKVLNKIAQGLIDFKTDLDVLFLFDDFEFADMKNFK